MIRVNLLKNKAKGSRGGQTQLGDVTYTETEGTSIEVGAGGGSVVVKVLVMLLGVVGLYAYETYNISNLQAHSLRLNSELTRLTNEVNQKQPEVEKAKGLQTQNEELHRKIELVKSMGKLRLLEIRAMDHLQNIVPEKVWFNSVEFKDGQLQLKGVSANDSELDKLLKGIQSYSTFQDVLLSRSVEEKTKQGTLKSFVITSNLAGKGAM